MGIKNLNTLICDFAKDAIQKRSLEYYRGKKFAIDANVYIYKYLYGNSNHINGIFFQINKLMKHGIVPVYVFDGKPPKEKEATVINRQNTKLRIKDKIGGFMNQLKDISDTVDSPEIEQRKFMLINEIKRLKKKLIYITDDVIVKTQQLLDLMGVTYVLAPTEAEHYCSILVKEYIVDGVLSEDMDTIACGSFIILRKFSNKLDYIYEYNLEKILENLGLTRAQLIDLCILCGNDYINRLRYIDQNDAYRLIRRYGNIESIISSRIHNFPINYDYKTLRKIYKLEEVSISTKDIVNINKKKEYCIKGLIDFLKHNSTIDSKIFLHRITKIYNTLNPQIDFKSNCLKSSYFTMLKTNNYISLSQGS